MREVFENQQYVQQGLSPLGEADRQRHYDRGAAKSILWLMRETWTNHGQPGEPYSDRAALEIASNELMDYAIGERDFQVRHDDGLMTPVRGVKIDSLETAGEPHE